MEIQPPDQGTPVIPTEPIQPVESDDVIEPLQPSRASRHSTQPTVAPAPGRGSSRVGGVIVLIGGILLACGAVIPWLDVTFQTEVLEGFAEQLEGVPTSGGLNAVDYGWLGQAAIACGTLLLILGLIATFSRGGRRVLGVFAIIVGLAGASLGMVAVVTAEDHAATMVGADFDKKVASMDVPPAIQPAVDDVRTNLMEAYSVTPGIGLWLAIGGGILGVGGGILVARQRQRRSAQGGTAL